MNSLLALVLLLLPKEPAPPATLALTNVTVIDVTGSLARPGMTVVIRGNRIAALGATGKVAVPKGARERPFRVNRVFLYYGV